MFGVCYFGMDELITRSNISPVDHKSLYPLFVFDVTRQSEKLKTSVVDVQIRAMFNEECPIKNDSTAATKIDSKTTQLTL